MIAPPTFDVVRRAAGAARMAVIAVAFAGSLSVAYGCAGPDGGGRQSAAAARTEIEEVMRQWEAALVAGVPHEAVSEVFTRAAVRLPPGEAATRGRARIAEALAGSVPVREARFDIEDLDAYADLAVAYGAYLIVVAEDAVLRGKFLQVWKRTEGGWRIHRVMWE